MFSRVYQDKNGEQFFRARGQWVERQGFTNTKGVAEWSHDQWPFISRDRGCHSSVPNSFNSPLKRAFWHRRRSNIQPPKADTLHRPAVWTPSYAVSPVDSVVFLMFSGAPPPKANRPPGIVFLKHQDPPFLISFIFVSEGSVWVCVWGGGCPSTQFVPIWDVHTIPELKAN